MTTIKVSYTSQVQMVLMIKIITPCRQHNGNKRFSKGCQELARISKPVRWSGTNREVLGTWGKLKKKCHVS